MGYGVHNTEGDEDGVTSNPSLMNLNLGHNTQTDLDNNESANGTNSRRGSVNTIGSRPGSRGNQYASKKKKIKVYKYLDKIKLIVKGTWKDGKLFGKGKLEVPQVGENLEKSKDRTNFNNIKTTIIYNGDFEAGRKHGKGKYIY